jgi:endonuclease/exonuclease/phosphatase family metal-dependent hydrolase
VITVVFWNLSKNPETLPYAARLARHEAADILLLAEPPPDSASAVSSLNQVIQGHYRQAALVRTKVLVLTQLDSEHMAHVESSIGGETAVWRLTTTRILPEVLLAVTHLPAKLGGITPIDQAIRAKEVARFLCSVEDQRNHQNTVCVGDFNMNPYDDGMIRVDGFGGVMTMMLARKPPRKHRGNQYRRFYNPMWGRFGDTTPGPAGTHYWRHSAPANTHWAMFDQVLVRPSLHSCLKDLEIIDKDGALALALADGAPDKSFLSDHLPIRFRLDI